jgi:hypothetical protein
MHPFNKDASLNLCLKTYYAVSGNTDPDWMNQISLDLTGSSRKKLEKSLLSYLTASIPTGIIIPVSQPV